MVRGPEAARPDEPQVAAERGVEVAQAIAASASFAAAISLST
jgi:hypothetical protein